MEPIELGKAIHEWARRHGSLSAPGALSSDVVMGIGAIFEIEAEDSRLLTERFQRLKITSVAADPANNTVTILCRGSVTAATLKKLPKTAHGIDIRYAGKVVIDSNPPVVPLSAASGSPLWFTHLDALSCGSSVTAGPVHGAGTLGFLATLADGRMVGVSNNHVTGDCNHTPAGMHIMSPAPFDASPASPPPTAVGKHLALVPLQSGDPGQICLQEMDLAIFEITRPELLSSMQGNGSYDTPPTVANLEGGMRVKKVGRTTGLRFGTVLGHAVLPISIPYRSASFSSLVYFSDVWSVIGDNNGTFSEPGDSGSLVVTEDGAFAVGLVFAGGGNVSFIIPIQKMLAHFNLTLLSGHNVERPEDDDARDKLAPEAQSA